jgi:uncharacterized protein DUF4012
MLKKLTAQVKQVFAKIFNKKTKTNKIDSKLNKTDKKETTEKTPISKPSDISKSRIKFKFQLPRKKWQIALLVLAFLFVLTASIGGVIGYKSYKVAMQIKTQALEAKVIASQAYDTFKAQDLNGTKVKLEDLDNKLQEIKVSYAQLSFTNKIPIIKNYFNDGASSLAAAEHGLNAGRKTIDTLVPYADVLGFAGEGSFTGGTAEDRVKIMLDTLEKIMPEFDGIVAELNSAKDELQKIDANRYEFKHFPKKVKDLDIKNQIIQIQSISQNAVTALTDFRPVIEKLPDIAGSGEGNRKKYLILFQNDNELRATGGFLTAYAVVFIENGKVYPEKSDDIYELDQKFTKRIDIPPALGKYLTTEKYWHLRDMNTSPDFKISMDTFFEHYQTVPGEPANIDGIIAVDTHVLTALLKIIGPTEIPGRGTFSAEIDPRCDCPQVVYALSEIITKPTPYLREDRKGILGPMMQSILQKTYGAPKQQWPDIFSLLWTSMQGRHLQMYFTDEESQVAAEAVNAAGRMEMEEGADFLGIVDANLGGAKSNLFTSYEVEQIIENPPQDGILTKNVIISYKNSRKGDNCNLEAGLLCLNATMPDWNRLYLPNGAELIEVQGYEVEPSVYDEEGFTVIDGFFKLEPEGVAKIKVTYSVPYNNQEIYKIKIWKQGGIDPIKNLMDVTGGQEEIIVDKDTVYEVEF